MKEKKDASSDKEKSDEAKDGTENKKDDEPHERPTRIAERFIFNWGPKGGFRVAVDKWPDGNLQLTFNRWKQKGKPLFIGIGKEENWLKLKRFVDRDLSQYLGWAGYTIPETEKGQFISVEDHERDIKQLEKSFKIRTNDLRETNADMIQTIKRLREENRKKFKTRIPEFKIKLKKFKKMIDEGLNEHDMHPFLKENFWIFGPHYIATKKEQKIGLNHRIDLLLEREDGYFDIVELKGTKAPVFSRKRLSGDSKNAVSQMITYLHKCDKLYSFHLSELKMDILKPNGYIVIGRKESEDQKVVEEIEENLRVYNAYLVNMQIMTYDQLYETSKQIIKKFES